MNVIEANNYEALTAPSGGYSGNTDVLG